MNTVIEHGVLSYLFHFIALEWLNTHTCWCQNARLCRDLGLK